MVILLILQLAATAPGTDRLKAPAAACHGPAEPGDVVVCGRQDQEQFRLRPLPDRYSADSPALPSAETSIFKGKAKLSAETEQGSVGGVPSNRAMVRIKIPLGR